MWGVLKTEYGHEVSHSVQPHHNCHNIVTNEPDSNTSGGGPHGDLPDPVAEAGPVASLWALARTTPKVATDSRWVVIPVDMPLLEGPLLRRLAAAGPRPAFFAGHPLPLALTMDNATRDVLERMGERLSAGKSISVHHVLELLEADTLSPDAAERAQLVNANTREEWDQLTGRGPANR